MSTHSTTQALPGIGAANAPRANLRAYLAGTGATTALIAGLLILFLAAGAWVAFNGNPFGGDDASDNVTIGNQTAGAPEAAALALASGPDAVAGTPTALAGGPGAAVDGGAAFAAGVPGAAPPGATVPGAGPGGGDGGTAVPPGGGGSGGTLGNTVGAVDDVTNSLGLNLNLGQTTGPLTERLDRTVTDTLNNVRDGNGRGLGDTVNDTVGGVRDGLNRGLGNLGLGR
jgi:hypothetical protein